MMRSPITPGRPDRRPDILESCAAFVRELEECYTAPLATPELDEVLARCVPGGYPDGGRRPAPCGVAMSAAPERARISGETTDSTGP